MGNSRTFVGKLLAILILPLCIGCATSASNLKLSEVPKGEVPLVGHIDIYIDDEVRTGRCYVTLSDEEGSRKAYISLDKTGWIFAHVKPGAVILSGANCTEGTIFMHPVLYTAKELQFCLPDSSNVSYFGHVTLRLADKNPLPGLALFGLAGAATQAAIGAGHDDASKPFLVENRMPEALQEYRQRLGSEAEKTSLVAVSAVPPSQTLPTCK